MLNNRVYDTIKHETRTELIIQAKCPKILPNVWTLSRTEQTARENCRENRRTVF